MERFSCETMVVSGEGALAVLGERRCRRMMVVTDPVTAGGGLVRKIVEAAGCKDTACFDAVDPEPTMYQAVEGAQRLKEFRPDLVAALGGENVLDCAKAMVCFSKQPCTLAAVPTAFGSGTEVTDRVVLTHERRRHLLRDGKMRPVLAVLDGSLLEGLSRGEAGEGGFTLLAVSLEAYSARQTGIITDIHAREAFVMGWGALPAAFAGNSRARQRLQAASAMAGMASDRTGLGLCRAMENSLGSIFPLSRGKLAGILLPAIIGCNAHAAGRKYAELARAAGMGGSNEGIGLRNLKSGLIRLRRELGMPGTLAQAGIDPRSVWSNARRIVELTLEDPECRNNPVTADDFMVRRILEEVTGRL